MTSTAAAGVVLQIVQADRGFVSRSIASGVLDGGSILLQKSIRRSLT